MGKDATARQPGNAAPGALDLRILRFLENSPYVYGNQVVIGVKARKELLRFAWPYQPSDGLTRGRIISP
jgi:hypothetical protein